MTTDTEQLRLAADFAPASEADWRKLVDGVLKGAAFEKLVGRTYDGLKIQPIYPRAKDAAPVAGRAPAAAWQIMQRVDHPDAAKANAQALLDLENGATGLTLVFAGANAAHGFGLPATADALARALDGVHLDAAIAIELQASNATATALLADYVKQRGVKPGACDIRFGLDPIGDAASRGASSHDQSKLAGSAVDLVKQLQNEGFKGPFFAADGRVVHDAGGSEAQELAFVLASAVAYLRALEASGVALETARDLISARLAADTDQFLTLAKFRSLRRLWARIEQACGLTPKPLFISGETAWRMLTRRDPYVNMLRATIATFAAGLGGANAVTVLPHTAALGLPDTFARRVARNTQLVLLEESNLARVADPAAGAGGIEALTSELCTTAWALFQDIENAGGVVAALQSGLIQSKVAAVKQARDANIAKRRDVLTGASEFPNLNEAEVAVEAVAPSAPPPAPKAALTFAPLTPIRLADAFEKLRDRSDALLKSKGQRPQVFLANLGTAADYTARATFARSFFEAGGIAAIDGQGGADPAALAEAYRASGAAIVCLCSSDKVYADAAVPAAKALQAAGARHIYLAGRGGEQEAALREAGIGSFVFAGGDALKTLEDAYTHLE
ncbi:Methylmalonyl-CoA mutase small subunit (MCM-beta) [Bradyrhizobium sp. ORS 285]|uniref:methylmalonyl-CoA mutase subunit beta n=1 Tax=Bradyrhizobium sp. ORS 285 TaxID=115808 RepID=UPI0002409579|nr:methylmalonyl-CoA mutase subunit beta [Bradyrhizobium sp. ORS 285]CCD89246.1 Methylmalonyl-CoA mutase small subunit (MCM-beta) [Bradyrhizobium sp. ORS 285]SMX59504.1 Methylmalonyl-CoA mutase small subunit (MCM-beta) [Bradyrhizobium sp. ORS 285]